MPLAAAYKNSARNQEKVIMKIDKNKVFAVIMAGGKGERLWPLSTEERPKPLISLNGQQTLLEDTVQRLFPLLNAENVFVITDEKSAAQASEILMLPPENIIAELSQKYCTVYCTGSSINQKTLCRCHHDRAARRSQNNTSQAFSGRFDRLY